MALVQLHSYGLDATKEIDPLDVRTMTERWLVGEAMADRALAGGWRLGELPEARDLNKVLRDFPAAGLEAVTEYGNAGLWSDGTALLAQIIEATPDKTRVTPLAYYYLGQFGERLGDSMKADLYRYAAMRASPEFSFPFQWEAIHVLRHAMEVNPKDANAPYILGNLLYDWQPEEAMKLWEQSAALDPSNPLVHRNLAVAYSHRGTNSDIPKAIAQLEQAVSAEQKYAMHFTELDELYADAGKPPELRLALLERNQAVVSKRDDALSHEIGLKVFAGKYDEAIQLMTGRKFSVWEGGTLDVADHWVNAHLLRGQQKFAAKQFAAALEDFQAAENIPDNLPSDRGGGRGHEAEIAYWTGLAQEAMGDAEKAMLSWQRAALASTDRSGRRGGSGSGFVSDRSVQRYYQALAQKKLGQSAEAETALRGMLDAANRALERGPGDSSGAVGERQSARSRVTLAHYLAGLAHLGLGETELAKRDFALALQSSPDHLGATTALGQLR